jgi:hypothetical protein
LSDQGRPFLMLMRRQYVFYFKEYQIQKLMMGVFHLIMSSLRSARLLDAATGWA